MNIFLQTAQKINSPDLPRQQNLNVSSKAGFETFLFNSIMDSLKSENTVYKTNEQVKLSSVKTDSHSARSEERETKRSVRSDKSEIKSYDKKTDDSDRELRIDDDLKRKEMSKLQNQTDDAPYNEDVTEEKAVTEKPETGLLDESDETGAVKNDSELNDENIGSTINELLPHSGLMNKIIGTPNELTAKNDALLMNTGSSDPKHLTNNQSVPIQKDDMVNIHKDIHDTTLMSHVMKGEQATGDLETDQTIKAENTSSINREVSETKNSSKMNGAISDLNDESLEIENEIVEEMMRRTEVKKDSGDSKSTVRETVVQANKNINNTINQFKLYQSGGDMAKAGAGLEHNNVLVLGNKLTSQMTGTINTEDGNNYVNSLSKSGTSGSEAHDTAMFSDSRSAVYKGGVNEGFRAGHVSRQGSFNEIIDKIVYVAKGNNRLGVSLEHERFGKVHINLSMEKGVVNVHLNTADHALREYVENNIHHIIDSLSKNGLNIGGFSVSLKNYNNGEKNTERGSNNENKIMNKEYVNAKNSVRHSEGLVNIFA